MSDEALGSEFQIILRRADGTRIDTITDAASFEYTRVLNSPGVFVIHLPQTFDKSLIGRDNLVEFWRKPAGGVFRRELVGYLLMWEYGTSEQGQETITIAGPDETDLLRRRIIAYSAGSSEADKTDQSDDILKALARENLGSSATTGRDISDWGFSVADDTGAGVSLTKSFSYLNLLEAMQGVVSTARQLATETFFTIERTSDSTVQFNTFVSQRVDRRESSSSPLIFSRQSRSLGASRYQVDWREEANAVYAGGQDEGAARDVLAATDNTAATGTPIGRTEVFVDARNNASTALGVYYAARAGLVEHRVKKVYEASVKSVPGYTCGVDWDLGYRVTVHDYDLSFDCIVRVVNVSRSADGKETITGILESYLT